MQRSILKNLKLMIIAPLLGLFIFLAIEIKNTSPKINKILEIKTVLKDFRLINSVLFLLQKERALSSAYIEKPNKTNTKNLSKIFESTVKYTLLLSNLSQKGASQFLKPLKSTITSSSSHMDDLKFYLKAIKDNQEAVFKKQFKPLSKDNFYHYQINHIHKNSALYGKNHNRYGFIDFNNLYKIINSTINNKLLQTQYLAILVNQIEINFNIINRVKALENQEKQLNLLISNYCKPILCAKFKTLLANNLESLSKNKANTANLEILNKKYKNLINQNEQYFYLQKFYIQLYNDDLNNDKKALEHALAYKILLFIVLVIFSLWLYKRIKNDLNTLLLISFHG